MADTSLDVTVENVQKAYIAYFGRPADAAGLLFWTKAPAGTTMIDVMNNFAKAAEFSSVYPNASNYYALVNGIYQNLFGHDADQAGATFWVTALNAGEVTPGYVAYNIARGAQGTDTTALASKVAFSTSFTDALLANPAAAAQYGASTIPAVRTQLATITTDAASAAAVAGLPAQVAGLGSAAVVGQTFTLTTGSDTGASFIGGSANDTFVGNEVAAGNTWTVGDAIDGGAGTDTFSVIQTGAVALPTGATVKGIETASFLSGTTGNKISSTSWTGLTALNVTGVTTQTVTAAATTDVSVTGSTATGTTTVNGGKNVTVTLTGVDGGSVKIGETTAAAGTVTVNATGGGTGSEIIVIGGTEISITQKNTNAVVNTTEFDGNVEITGTAATKTVTVASDKAVTASATVAGHGNANVTITDVNAGSTTDAGTITSATVSNFASLLIENNALTTLSVTGGAGNIIIDNSGLTTATNKTLGVTVNAQTKGTLDDADIYTTLNITGTGKASTLSNVTFGATTALNVDGSAAVTLTSVAGLSALTAVTSTNTAGLKLGSAIGAGVSFTGGEGADAVVLGATTKAITTGAGNDTVTSAGLVGTGGSVDAGEGTDTIVMSSAEAAVADNTATFNTKFKNFEVLSLSDALGAGTTLDLAGINAVSTVVLTAGGADVATAILSNLVSGSTVKQTGDGTGVVVNVANATFGAADVLNLDLSKSTALAAGTITAAGVETVNITAADANTTLTSAAVVHTATLTAADATSIKLTGNNGLNLTATGSVKVTSFDASGVVGNSTATVIDTAANLAVTYTSLNATGTAVVTITGGAGNDTLTGAAAKDTISGGAGADNLDGKSGVDTLTGGAGIDIFTIGAAEAGITGAEKITDFVVGLSGDNLNLATTTLVANQTATNVTGAVGGAVDVTATVKSGIITLGGADAALVDTIGEIKAIFELLDANGSAEVAAVVLNGQTYVITDSVADTVNDIIQLTGVTTATSLALASAAGTILIS